MKAFKYIAFLALLLVSPLVLSQHVGIQLNGRLGDGTSYGVQIGNGYHYNDNRGYRYGNRYDHRHDNHYNDHYRYDRYYRQQRYRSYYQYPYYRADTIIGNGPHDIQRIRVSYPCLDVYGYNAICYSWIYR